MPICDKCKVQIEFDLKNDKCVHCGECKYSEFEDDDEIEEEIYLESCPECGSDAVGYDDSDGFFECFQCDNNWIG